VKANPAKPPPGVALCRLDELADPGSRGFVFREGESQFKGFLVRKEGAVAGFVDECPHAGWPLAGGFGQNYLTRDHRYILCAGHGALFKPDNGECVSGPCFGDRLEPWPVRVEDGVVTTDEPSLIRPPPYWGGCACGAVRFEATSPPLNIRVCHCRLCQKATGQPFFARALFPRETIRVSGPVDRYAASPRQKRGFCRKCATPLFSEPLDRPSLIGVALASLDDPDALPPQMHVWTSRKVAWLKLDDGLPQYPEGAPS
jgi:nitrite reductase/ring-hydroxylating ferredoxin subunit